MSLIATGEGGEGRERINEIKDRSIKGIQSREQRTTD